MNIYVQSVCYVIYMYVSYLQQSEEWVARKTLRRDKFERVELQQNLENELRAKQKLQEELTSARTQLAHSER